MPLIKINHLLKETYRHGYADDSSYAAKLKDLRDEFDKLCELGPDYGYYPEPSKSFLVVDPSDLQSDQGMFGYYGVQFVPGHRFLGRYVGDPQCSLDFVQSKQLGSLY